MARSNADQSPSSADASALPGFFAMPRQPYLKLVRNTRGTKFEVGSKALGQRPALQARIGDCILAWTFVEAEMALVLAILLQGESNASVAVFQTLRRSTSQRAALIAAAEASLSPTDIELSSALLAFHASVESERNALCHGCFGTSTKLPNDLIWQTSANYLKFRSHFAFKGINSWNDAMHLQLMESLSVYRLKDIQAIYREIDDLAHSWFSFGAYIQSHRLNPQTSPQLYAQLCGQPRIAQELKTLRQKNVHEEPSQPPPPTDDETD